MTYYLYNGNHLISPFSIQSQWKIGKTLEQIKSNDAQIRVAMVLAKTNRTENLIRRSINRLYLLESDKKDENKKIRFIDDANIEGALSGPRQLLKNESSLKMMKNNFYFTLKAFFSIKILKFLS